MAITPDVISVHPGFEQVIGGVFAAAIHGLLKIWRKSSDTLLLPRSMRWVPFGAALLSVAVLMIFFTSCALLKPLVIFAFAFGFVTLVLGFVQYRLSNKGTTMKNEPDEPASVLVVLVSVIWNISLVATICTAVTALVAKQQMDQIYKEHPLKLWQIVGGKRRIPEDTIFLTAGLSTYLRPELQECRNVSAETTISPKIGNLDGEVYKAPQSVNEETSITFTARSACYGDVKTATIMLLPDAANLKRIQYPADDVHGQKATLDVIVISKENSWVYQDEQQLEMSNHGVRLSAATSTGQVVPACQPVIDLAQSHAFDAYADIIAVGTASHEGGETKEVGRAYRRSKTIGIWVNWSLRRMGRTKRVYVMNLGQYHDSGQTRLNLTTNQTAKERRVILIGVVRNTDFDVKTGIQKKIEESTDAFFKDLREHYTGRDISPFDAVPQDGQSCSPVQ